MAKLPQTGPAIDVRSVVYSTMPMHEITFAMKENPNLLCQLTSMLNELGLAIREFHAFPTSDGYGLDIFMVDGWQRDTEELREAVMHELLKLENEGTDGWGKIDVAKLVIRNRIAFWSNGKVYEGTFYGQEVAIKIVDEEKVYDESVVKEFKQEIKIMRKVPHKNVVQFIGAYIKMPKLYIVTELMSRGSVRAVLQERGGGFELPPLLRIATGIAEAMNYMHQQRIIHRDLRTENLLMDEHQVVKVAEFGLARVKPRSGRMTPETGTLRWMAPEVILRQMYDHKADVFSFGILLWELLTGEVPYEGLLQVPAATRVVQEGLRPVIPEDTNEMLSRLMQDCWSQVPELRPEFSEILLRLEEIEN